MRPADGAGRGAPELAWFGFASSVIESSSSYQTTKNLKRYRFPSH
jgi:hypothetical protein